MTQRVLKYCIPVTNISHQYGTVATNNESVMSLSELRELVRDREAWKPFFWLLYPAMVR